MNQVANLIAIGADGDEQKRAGVHGNHLQVANRLAQPVGSVKIGESGCIDESRHDGNEREEQIGRAGVEDEHLDGRDAPTDGGVAANDDEDEKEIAEDRQSHS